jgi:hypothetical protein
MAVFLNHKQADSFIPIDNPDNLFFGISLLYLLGNIKKLRLRYILGSSSYNPEIRLLITRCAFSCFPHFFNTGFKSHCLIWFNFDNPVNHYNFYN